MRGAASIAAMRLLWCACRCPRTPVLQAVIRMFNHEGSVLLPSDAEVQAAGAAGPGNSSSSGKRAWLGCYTGQAVMDLGVVAGVVEGQGSTEACCRRCREHQTAANSSTPCNAFNWCGDPQGCR